MNRKLLMLNVLLAAAVVYAGFQFRSQWAAAKARDAARLNVKQAPLPPPANPPMPQPPVLVPSSYKDVATNDLFDQSRNPNVPIELPPPPPPPKDPPPLPSFYGMMNIGDGYIAIMSKGGGGQQQEVRAGEMIGDFKLLDFNTKEITLEWDGRTIHKRLDEFAKQDGQQGRGRGSGNTLPMPGVAPPPQPPPVMRDLGPGQDVGLGANRPCQAGDSSPAGAIQDGYRKVVTATMFGNECHWSPVGK